MTTQKKYYWLSHKRCLLNGRLAWFAEAPSPEFWSEYWKNTMSESSLREVEKGYFEKDSMGRLIMSHLDPHGKHLEAGCGTGTIPVTLQKKGYDIRGIDSSPDLIKHLKSINPDAPIHLGDALSIAAPEATYDSYISLGVVEHREEGPEPFLEEAYRVLKPKGKLIISVPYFGPLRQFKKIFKAYDPERPAEPFFQYAFSEKEFIEMVRLAGFDILSIHHYDAHRMLLEECSFYRFLMQLRGARWIRKILEGLICKQDGHMLAVVGEKN